MTAIRSMMLPMFALVAALAGCSAESGTSAGAGSADDARSSISAETADDADGEHGPERAMLPGPEFLVAAALHAPINLTAEQRTTIEGLLSANRPSGHHFDPARASKLAAAIRSNSPELAQEAKWDDSAREAHLEASAKMLASLHDTLTPAQRVALVDSIEKHAPKHGRGPGAHARKRPTQDDRAARGPRPDGDRHLRPHGGPGPGPMFLLHGIDLTQEQKEALRAKLEAERPAKPSEAEREAMKTKFLAMRTEMKARLESFKGDAFDAKAFVTPPSGFDKPMGPSPAKELATVVSILTPAQREALAARIEKGPMLHDARVKPAAAHAPQVTQ